MANRTLAEIQEFVSGTVTTELYVAENEYPYVYVGEALMGWAEYLDTSNFDALAALGMTSKAIRVDAPYDCPDDFNGIINEHGDSLTETLAALEALGPHISIKRFD